MLALMQNVKLCIYMNLINTVTGVFILKVK